MLVLLAKVFVVIFTLLVIAKSYLDLRNKKGSIVMFIFWTVTWLAISAFAFFPRLVDYVLGNPRQNGGVGTALGIGLIFIYFIIYRVYVKADRIEKQLSKLIREKSLGSTGLKSPKKK